MNKMIERVNTGEPVLVVAGIELSPQQIAAFTAYITSKGKIEVVARESGVPKGTLYQWRKTNWWKEMYRTHVTNRMQDIHMSLLDQGDVFEQALVDVATGNVDEPKLAGPMVKAAEVFMKLGHEPLLSSKPETISAPVNIGENRGTINIIKFAQLTQEQILEIHQTGKVPDSVKDSQ